MSGDFLALLASTPIILLLILMVGMRLSAVKAMPIVWIVTLGLALFAWDVPANFLLASNVNGLFVAFQILLIVFGALSLLFMLQESGAIASIKLGLTRISPDKRVQAIIIGWFFGGFIEGAAGFGTPAALVAPLLMSLGFPALAGAILALAFNSTTASFGAVGTPTLLGIDTSLNSPEVIQSVSAAGETYDGFIHHVGVWSALLHAIPSMILPILVVGLVTRFFGEKRSFKEGLDIWPFAIFAGVCFLTPYLLSAWLLGPEFPSLVGPLVGLAIIIPAVRSGFLVPKTVWDFPRKEKWESIWSGSIQTENTGNEGSVSLFRTLTPYLLVGLLLVISRIPVSGIGKCLAVINFKFTDLFGTGISNNFEPLKNPGVFPFVLITIFGFFIFRMKNEQISRVWKETFRKIKMPAIALFFAVPMVRLMMDSGYNDSNYSSMPIILADYLAGLSHGVWPVFAPFVGALGTFMAGSNTVSNMLFSMFQYSVADNLEISKTIVVSLQNVGGAIGNMICVHNIIAVCATVGLTGVEGLIIKRNLIPLAVYGLIAGVVGLVLTYIVLPGYF